MFQQQQAVVVVAQPLVEHPVDQAVAVQTQEVALEVAHLGKVILEADLQWVVVVAQAAADLVANLTVLEQMVELALYGRILALQLIMQVVAVVEWAVTEVLVAAAQAAEQIQVQQTLEVAVADIVLLVEQVDQEARALLN
jgi:hypothetical protein